MAKSKYTKYIPEILEMYFKGKKSTEIVTHLNENYKLDAAESSIRTICQRNHNQEKAETPEENIKLQEIITVEKMEELIINEVQIRLTAKEFSLVREKYQETFEVFSIINDEFGEVTATLRKRAKQKSCHFLLAGIWIVSMLFVLSAGYYMGRCFSKNAFHYALTLTGIPGGIFIGIAVGMAINRRKKKITE